MTYYFLVFVVCNDATNKCDVKYLRILFKSQKNVSLKENFASINARNFYI